MTYSKSTDTRARILERSLDLFAADGFDQTTLRKLAEACGLSLGAFYYYFKSKEAVVAEYFAQSSVYFSESLESVIAAELTSLGEDWEELCKLRFKEFKKHREILRTLSQFAFDKSSPVSLFHSSFQEIRSGSVEGFSRLLQKHGIDLDAKSQLAFSSLLWVSHLGVLLFWSWDKSPAQKKTQNLCAVASETIGLLYPLLPKATPFIGPLIAKWTDCFIERKKT